MKKKNNLSVGTLEELVRVIDQDLTGGFSIDGVANEVTHCLEDKVNPDLLELLNLMLLGFNEEMQLEIADDLLDFACSHVVHTTGCLSADAVLKSCYGWIAAEQGFSKSDIENTIINLNN